MLPAHAGAAVPPDVIGNFTNAADGVLTSRVYPLESFELQRASSDSTVRSLTCFGRDGEMAAVVLETGDFCDVEFR